MRFTNRAEAGRALAARLEGYKDRNDVVVLGLPRGGVPVAAEVAAFLQAPLDVFVVRKLGVPGQTELAMGAIASGGIRVVNREVVDALAIAPETLDRVAAEEQVELERREREYRGDEPAESIAGRVAMLVDDGLATGSTMRAAVMAARQRQPARVVVAVPVAPASTCQALLADADEVVCVLAPTAFSAVGLWYEDFTQTTDADVHRLLAIARPARRTRTP